MVDRAARSGVGDARSDIASLDHMELWPAKGPGGLAHDCRDTRPARGQGPRLQIAEVPAAESQAQLEAARVLADTLKLPLRTEAEYDC